MHQANILRIVVASPSDVQAERDALRTVLEELNQGIAGERGLRLELARWETDAYPGFHPEGPQGADRCHPTYRGLRHPHRDFLETLRHSGAGCQLWHRARISPRL